MPRLYKKLPSWLRLPNPREMGMSDHSMAMPSRLFDPFNEDFCWEDWHKVVKVKYPFRYFLLETLPHYLSVKVKMPLQNLYWYCRDKLITRHYLVDIRQGYNGHDIYRWGYLDSDTKILYASFSILKEFVEKEKPPKPQEVEIPEKDDPYYPVALAQQQAMATVYNLYSYWMEERGQLSQELASLWERQREAARLGDEELYHQLRKDRASLRDKFDQKEKECLLDLVKVSPYMWT